MFPDTVSLNMTAIDDHQYNDKLLSFWNSVYGINMTAMADKERREPRLLNVEEDQMRTNKIILQEIDMNTVKMTDIQLTSPFHLEVLKKGYIRGIALHYSVGFTSGRERIQYPEKDKASKQSVLFLKDFLICSSGDDLVGLITMEHTERGVRINLSGVKLKVGRLKVEGLLLNVSIRARSNRKFRAWTLLKISEKSFSKIQILEKGNYKKRFPKNVRSLSDSVQPITHNHRSSYSSFSL